jgi:biopolymer transport protein TolR
MRNRQSHRPMSQINVVPYIDVMLVLLVIFMVTAPMMTTGQIDLPSVGKSQTPPTAPMEVIIHKDGSLALRNHIVNSRERELTREELLNSVREAQSANPDQPVVISADKKVQYDEVIKVMDMLQRENIKKVGLLTQSK